jgi:DNA-directed RNA polymerase subunit omega
MNPSIVFDCEKILPNRFALTMAAAARSRALYRGAEPRLDPSDACVSELALQEIARGSFTSSELAPFLGGPAGTKRLHSADPATHLRGNGEQSPLQHPSPRHRRRFNDDANK